MIIMLTGLTASGKSTIDKHIFEMWKPEAPNTVFVDGDDIRSLVKFNTSDDAYTREGRHVTAARYSDLCGWLDRQGINVVCCTISFFDDIRRRNREEFSKYFEVYISVPMDVLQRRDVKDLYAQAERGEAKNVVGVDLMLDPPTDPDFVVDNSEDQEDLRPLAREILDRALSA